MKILVLNCGSSSIKYKLFDMTSGEVMAQGGIEKIGLPGAFLKLTDKEGKKVVIEREIPGHQQGIEFILSVLTDATYGCIKDYKEIDAVGHRLVHGGEEFASSVLINQDVINKVIECSDLAPLHNPANLKGVRAMEALIPGIPQLARQLHRAVRRRPPHPAHAPGLECRLLLREQTPARPPHRRAAERPRQRHRPVPDRPVVHLTRLHPPRRAHRLGSRQPQPTAEPVGRTPHRTESRPVRRI